MFCNEAFNKLKLNKSKLQLRNRTTFMCLGKELRYRHVQETQYIFILNSQYMAVHCVYRERACECVS